MALFAFAKEERILETSARTPCYVLKDGSFPACPSILASDSGISAIVIFGFSDKPEYDLFIKNSLRTLTPYPLVKRFIENQIANNIDALKLFVLDASSEHELILPAATMESVLKALQQKLQTVSVTHHLDLDKPLQAYDVQFDVTDELDRSAI